MESADVKRLALVLAVQAEIEGMKAANAERLEAGYALAYNRDSFYEKSQELRNLAACHDDQL